MSLNVGLTANEEYCCIVGFSGKIIDKNHLKVKMNAIHNVLMIHGDADEIVTPNFLLEAKDFLMRKMSISKLIY